MKEYDTSDHTSITPITVKCNADECCCVKHCKGRNMNWENTECKECYRKTLQEIGKV